MAYDASEQDVLLAEFTRMLRAATVDGGKKRAGGLKPPWWNDSSHEAAIFSHLNKWKHGENVDGESGAHPLVHLAWRALAIAYQETRGRVDPAMRDKWLCRHCKIPIIRVLYYTVAKWKHADGYFSCPQRDGNTADL